MVLFFFNPSAILVVIENPILLKDKSKWINSLFKATQLLNFYDQSLPIPIELLDKSRTFKFDLLKLSNIIPAPFPVILLKCK